MNIDGLAESAGMDTWHVDNNPTGQSNIAGTLTLCVNTLLCKQRLPMPRLTFVVLPGPSPLLHHTALLAALSCIPPVPCNALPYSPALQLCPAVLPCCPALQSCPASLLSPKLLPEALPCSPALHLSAAYNFCPEALPCLAAWLSDTLPFDQLLLKVSFQHLTLPISLHLILP